MSNRFLVVVLLGSAISSVCSAAARPGETYRIGVLSLTSAPEHEAPVFSLVEANELFLRTLGEFGYREGENLLIERRFADGKMDRLPELAKDLVQLGPDLILIESTPATFAAQEATNQIPLLFSLSANPVSNGFVTSLARPGGNMTGYFWNFTYATKWLQLLKELSPELRRVARLCPAEEIERCKGPWLEEEARQLDLEIEVMEAQGSEDFDRFFDAAESVGFDAVLVSPMASYYGVLERPLGEAAARSGMPVIFDTADFVRAGGLIAYYPAGVDFGERMAVMVDAILQGADPALIPVESPSRFELWLNLATAREQGLEVPPGIMIQATHIIE